MLRKTIVIALIAVLLVIGIAPVNSQDPESFQESAGVSYVDWSVVELSMAILFDAIFIQFDEGQISEAGLDALLANFDETYAYLFDSQEYYGTGGPMEAAPDTYSYQVMGGHQINLSSAPAAAQGAQATPSTAMNLYIDEFGQAYLSMEQNQEFDDHALALSEGWEKEYDALMLKMMEMVGEFVVEHAEPVVDPLSPDQDL